MDQNVSNLENKEVTSKNITCVTQYRNYIYFCFKYAKCPIDVELEQINKIIQQQIPDASLPLNYLNRHKLVATIIVQIYCMGPVNIMFCSSNVWSELDNLYKVATKFIVLNKNPAHHCSL